MLLDGAGPLFAGFDNRYMTLGSMNDRSQYARTMIELGLLSPNEWRDMEGLDPRPGGDEYLKPLNMDSGTTPKGNEDDETKP
jgi:phage portal protein BeeE